MTSIDRGSPGPLRRLGDLYESNAGLRAAVESIPHIGAALGALLSGDRRAWFEERLRLFFEDLRSEVEDILRKSGLNEQVIQSQGYAHLMLLAMEAAVRSRSNEKRRLNARLLARRASLQGPSDEDRAEEVMHSLAELTMTELNVLKAVSEAPTDHQGVDPKSLTKVTGLTEEEITAYSARLQKTGFVVVKTLNIITMMGSNPVPVRVYPTPLLSHLTRLITEK